MVKERISAYFEILRPINCIMAAVAVYISIFIASGDIYNFNFYAMAAAFFVCAGGMVINDYFDIEIDKVNKPKRPLPSGRISLKTSLIYATFLFVIGNGAAISIGIPVFLFALFNTVVEVIYAERGKQMPFVGNVMVSFLVGSLFIFGGLVANNITPLLVLAILAFLANISRELFKTAEDIRGDIGQGAKTVAVLYGKEKTEKIATVFLIVPVILSFLPVYLNILNILYLYTVLIADLIFIISIIKTRLASKLIKYGMFVALIAFVLGAL